MHTGRICRRGNSGGSASDEDRSVYSRAASELAKCYVIVLAGLRSDEVVGEENFATVTKKSGR